LLQESGSQRHLPCILHSRCRWDPCSVRTAAGGAGWDQARHCGDAPVSPSPEVLRPGGRVHSAARPPAVDRFMEPAAHLRVLRVVEAIVLLMRIAREVEQLALLVIAELDQLV